MNNNVWTIPKPLLQYAYGSFILIALFMLLIDLLGIMENQFYTSLTIFSFFLSTVLIYFISLQNTVATFVMSFTLTTAFTQRYIITYFYPGEIAFTEVLDFTTAEKDNILNMKPLNVTGWDKMYNIDGYATFSTSLNNQNVSSYNQIFRNGIYELYSSELLFETQDGRKGFIGKTMITETIRSIKEALIVLDQLQVEPPFLISFSFHNVLGKLLMNEIGSIPRQFKQNEIVFPLILIPNYESDIYSLLKPNFDILWQSFGFPKSIQIS